MSLASLRRNLAEERGREAERSMVHARRTMKDEAHRSAAVPPDQAEDASPSAPAAGYRPSPEEALLLARLRHGDEAAFAAFIDRHHAGLVRLALVFAPNKAVADEIVQETWAVFVDGLERFEGRSSLKTWLLRILSNRAKTRAIREKRSIPFSALDQDDSRPLDFSRDAHDLPARPGAAGGVSGRSHDENPEAMLLRREALEKLEEALVALPPAQRAVVVLRDIEGLESAEVCNVLEVTETNQRVLLHRGRARLRKALEDVWERG